jgi:hypothetical protein
VASGIDPTSVTVPTGSSTRPVGRRFATSRELTEGDASGAPRWQAAAKVAAKAEIVHDRIVNRQRMKSS